MGKFLILGLVGILQAFTSDSNTYCYGDSIAVGYCRNFMGKRKGGMPPKVILRYLETDSLQWKGKTVILSTGVSNNRKDFDSIEQQFMLLKRNNANVIVIGAARGRYDKENEKLVSLTEQFNFTFKGPFTPSSDRVHPLTYKTYR